MTEPIYPLSLPASPKPRESIMRLMRSVGSAKSPFTLSRQDEKHQGAQWQIEQSYPRMFRAEAAEWQAFLLRMQGRFGTCLIGDPDAETPRGTATGTPLVDSAGSPSINLARDTTLFTKGWTAGITGIMLKGDYLQLGSGLTAELYMAVEDANSDGSGLAALEIEPPLRSDHSTDEAIVVNSAKGLFKLVANDDGWDANAVSRYGFSIGFEESL